MPPVLKPIQETAKGVTCYLTGLAWLKRNPRFILMSMIPISIALIVFMYLSSWILGNQDWIFEKILFAKPESIWMLSVYYLAKTILFAGFFLTGFAMTVLLSNILSCPLYEWISAAVENDRTGKVEEISFVESLLLIKEELKKVAFILLVTVVLLVIPGLNLLVFVSTAFLLGWDAYDYPLARRGLSFRRRLLLALRDFWSVFGLGLWMMIPFVQSFIMPLAVVGGTILCLDTIREKGDPKK